MDRLVDRKRAADLGSKSTVDRPTLNLLGLRAVTSSRRDIPCAVRAEQLMTRSAVLQLWRAQLCQSVRGLASTRPKVPNQKSIRLQRRRPSTRTTKGRASWMRLWAGDWNSFETATLDEIICSLSNRRSIFDRLGAVVRLPRGSQLQHSSQCRSRVQTPAITS